MNQYKNLSIIGLGLIGSSIARAAKQFGVAENITAYDSNPLPLELGKQQGFVTKGVDSIKAALDSAELVIVATPPTASLALMPDIAEHIAHGTLVTDVLSIKTPVNEAFHQYLAGRALFVPSHPIAGSEKTGAAAGKADLFAGKRVILTPENPEQEGIEPLSQFWESLGAVVEYMPPDVHDMVYAYVSHLPQQLAFGYAPFAEKLAMEAEVPEYFSRFTRLCKSDRGLWDDIFIHNKQQLAPASARFLVLLTHIRNELAEGMEQEGVQAADIKQASKLRVWANWLPRLVASCLVATLAQQSRDVGFNFTRFAGSGFDDFTSPLLGDPEADMEAIAQHAPQVVEALDELLAALSENALY